MTIVDTIADAHYGDRVKMAMAFAALLNEEARELAADGVDVIQFDEPAFNVYMDEVATGASRRCTAPSTASPHDRRAYLLRLRHQGQHRVEGDARDRVAAIRRNSSRRWQSSRIDQVSLECINSHVPMSLLTLLDGKDVLIGAIDVATDTIETPRGGRRRDRAGAELRAEGEDHRLHQLRHGADAPRCRGEKARSARARRGAGARKASLNARYPQRSLRESTSISSPTLRRCSPLLPDAMACSTQWAT